MDRWATFDCYGTLIDWNGGIGRELEQLFGAGHVARLLNGYHELEREIEHERPAATYRDVLTTALCRLAEREDMPLAAADEDALARSLPSWQPFPEGAAALEDARSRGWKLAILSNTDDDFIAASQVQIGVVFDEVVVAQEIGSYKPAHRHWEEFFRRTNAPREGHVHVGASLFHDVAPSNELGLTSVWINRLGETSGDGNRPTRELPDLSGLPETLDDLVPA